MFAITRSMKSILSVFIFSAVLRLYLLNEKVFENEQRRQSKFNRSNAGYFEGQRKKPNCSNKNPSIYYGLNHFLNLAVPTDIAQYLNILGLSSDSTSFKVSKIPKLPVVLFAASSNHYLELQELLHDLHQKLFWLYPRTKLIFYDLGLKENENQWMRKYCKCEVRRFSFSSFPPHFRHLKTYAWKPIIIQMVLKEFDYVMYMDTSIRLKIADLSDLYRMTRRLGFMYLYTGSPYLISPYKVVQHTHLDMFQFFKLEVCHFHEAVEYQATMVIVVKNRMTHHVLMKWWVICALRQDCMAPSGTDKLLFCDPVIQKIGKCHRFDQSALNLIVYSILKHPKLHIISKDLIDVRRH